MTTTTRRRPTRSLTPKLSEAARHVVIPEGIVSTGYGGIRKWLRLMRVEHDPWQQGVGQIALGKTADGMYAATVGGITISIPRQVGKTFFVGSLVIALCLEFPGLTVVWTAHHLRTSTRTFQTLQSLVKRPGIAAYVPSNGVRTANGEQQIAFTNGSIILFGARSMGFGRGFEEVDVEVFDEAQILTERALEDMLAATNQSQHPAGALLFYLGTPPRPGVDPGEAFSKKRRKALAGELRNGAYIECSADRDGDIDDPEQWKIANASYPTRTSHESMLRLRENLPNDDGWRREGLGVWDEFWDQDESATENIIDPKLWSDMARGDAKLGKKIALAIDMSPDRNWVSIAAAARTSDGKVHVEVGYHSAPGPGLVRILLSLIDRWDPCALVIDKASPAYSLHPDLVAAGIEPEVTTAGQMVQACGGFYDDAVNANLCHTGDPLLADALKGATKRDLPGGGWAWNRKGNMTISPLVAVTLAHWALKVYDIAKPPPPPPAVAARTDPGPSGSGDLDVLTAAF